MGERNHSEGRSHLALTTAFTCANCDNGRHNLCRESQENKAPGAPMCMCVCGPAEKRYFGLTTPVLNESGQRVGARMDDGRVYGFGPMGVSA